MTNGDRHLLFVRVQARRDEEPELPEDERERDESSPASAPIFMVSMKGSKPDVYMNFTPLVCCRSL